MFLRVVRVCDNRLGSTGSLSGNTGDLFGDLLRRTLGHAFFVSLLLFLGGLSSGLGILDNNLFRRWDTINRDKLGLED